MQITSLFATPICALELPDSAALNAQIKTLLLQREGSEVANPYSSMDIPKGLFESDFNLFSWPDAPIQALRLQIWRAISAYVAILNNYDQSALNAIEIKSHTWFHITRRGGFFGLHNHPMASVSGVYCVHGGTHDPDQPNSALLRFHSPLAPVNMFIDPGNYRIDPAFAHAPRSFQLQAGQLILFPSWLMHEVQPYFGDDPRITVAFNCWFERQVKNINGKF